MAKSDQLWTCVGITVHDSVSKVRFGVDRIRRIKQFTKGGATRVDMVDLPQEMNKLDALNFMRAHEDFQSPEDQSVISDAYDYRAKVSGKTKGEVKVRVSRGKKAAPSMDSIKSRARKAKAQVSAEDVVQAATEGATGTDEPALV
jgi:CCR4-NOT transcriptional regulation complex NOT5 subunit